MHLARRAWCRTYQTVFRIALPVLPYTEPRILEHAEDVPAVLQKRSIQKVLIVTDPGIARLGLTASLERALTAQGIGVTVYAETRANPTVSNVEEAASLYRARACQAIIGFGGGSAMDCAKGVGARIAQPNKPINKMRGLLRVHRRLPLLIAVPTTAGTGSEVTLAAVITDDETGVGFARLLVQTHSQGDTFTLKIHFQHFHLHNVARFHHGMRIFHKLVRQ